MAVWLFLFTFLSSQLINLCHISNFSINFRFLKFFKNFFDIISLLWLLVYTLNHKNEYSHYISISFHSLFFFFKRDLVSIFQYFTFIYLSEKKINGRVDFFLKWRNSIWISSFKHYEWEWKGDGLWGRPIEMGCINRYKSRWGLRRYFFQKHIDIYYILKNFPFYRIKKFFELKNGSQK